MARAGKVGGAILVAIGLAAVLLCGLAVARDEQYRRAALVLTRNPGNVLYEAEFKGAQIRRAFQLAGAVAGALLALNGVTLFGLGVLAARLENKEGVTGHHLP